MSPLETLFVVSSALNVASVLAVSVYLAVRSIRNCRRPPPNLPSTWCEACGRAMVPGRIENAAGKITGRFTSCTMCDGIIRTNEHDFRGNVPLYRPRDW